jgi:hypothetical protein
MAAFSYSLRCVLSGLLLGVGLAGASAAEWQWSVEDRSEKPTNGPARAWLWVPPACEHLRGVVVAQHNMEEISILESSAFRARLAELGFAEVWIAPFFDHLFRFNAGAGEVFEDMLGRLADESGYSELKYVPVAPMGHSAAASWPYYYAAWKPERTLCALSVSGQWPYFRHKDFAPDIWGERTIDFVPCLESMGEYEAADPFGNEGVRQREQHPRLPLSMLANPGQGHFATSEVKNEFLGLYLKKCVQYRMPTNWDGRSAASLIPIDPVRTGWLADKWHRDREPSAPAAPAESYRGDATRAFWFFDEEHARATEQYQARFRGLKPQLVGYVQNGALVPQRETHLQVDLAFQPQSDGVTFRLVGGFYESVPGVSSRLTDWTLLPTNAPLGHSRSGAISIDPICGPVKKLSSDTFAFCLQKETLLRTNARSYEIVLAATHSGDADFKPAVQQAHMLVPASNAQGREQRISFPSIPELAAGAKAVKLNAASDAGLPVSYLVREGPAEVFGNELRFTAIPPRAKLPIRVTVIAWQYGSSLEPRVRTAAPVEQSFLLLRRP